MAGHGPSERSLDPGIRLVLEELRDLRLEMRADRQRADQERQRADQERQRADEERRQDRRLSELRFEKAMRESDQRFERAMLESREWFDEAMHESRERFDKAMRETQRVFRDVRTVGLSIVKTLNRHTRILERIERRLGEPGRWRPGPGNGRGGAQR
jgi:hypothetical protein